MNPLKRKTIWRDKKGPDTEKNELVSEIIRTELLSPGGGGPTIDRTLEIVSHIKDEFDRTVKKRRRFTADKGLTDDIRTALDDLAPYADKIGRSHAIRVQLQIRSEGSSGIVVTYEVPPFASRSEMKDHYVIGDGADIRFIFDSVSELQDLCRWLEMVVEG